MDIGKMIDNYTFYNGYEDEPEIILSIKNSDTIHIWEGYFEDIYGEPSLDGNGWTGFTRDYNQMEGIFANNEPVIEINPLEYLQDLMIYKNKTFDYDETVQVFHLISSLFEKAIKNGVTIIAKKR